MRKTDKLVASFKKELESNRRDIRDRRADLKRQTGHAIVKSQAAWLRKTALQQAKERAA
ncbi:hypothetical protein [Glutamicibacter protophormiae]